MSRWHDAGAQLAGAVDRLNNTPVRVAVTGLSRAGKTVFLTSLLSNLLASGAGRDTLPALRAVLDRGGVGRLGRVRLLPTGAETTPRFDHAAKLAELAAASPGWPARTDDLAEVGVELTIRPPASWRGSLRGCVGTPRLRLELLDYPGEWLLDLPLLSKSYAAWSRETLALLRQAPRAAVAASFLDQLRLVDANRPAEEALIRRTHGLYKEALERCRREHGLRYLQPGRFLCPGPRAEAPFLWFFPLEAAPDQPRRGSNAALLEDRFETYKRDMRASFFDTHFRDFDRQVVLVDVLGALHAGRAAYEDTERAVGEIAACLAGSQGLLARLRGRPPVERVAFVATKADHVPELQRGNLCALLRHMVQPAQAHGPRQSGAVSHHAAASVVSTRDGWVERADGPREAVVWGCKLGEAERRPYAVGAVPTARPPEGFWSGRYFELPVFRPPPLDASGAAGVPHLALDEVLAALVGDRL